jgi:hypothetical protein
VAVVVLYVNTKSVQFTTTNISEVYKSKNINIDVFINVSG